MVAADSLKKYLLPAWIALAAAYLFLIIPRLAGPITGWEAVMWQIPVDIIHKGFAGVRFFYAPPLGETLMAAAFGCFGISEWAARLPGAISFLAMPAVLYLIMKGLCREGLVPAAILAGLIYCTSPAAIQGSLTIDRFDATILTLTTGLFYVGVLKTEKKRYIPRMLTLGALFSLCLWTKLTTPLAFLAAVPLAYMLNGEGGKGVKVFLGMAICGAAFFAVTWGAFCVYVIGIQRFLEPIAYYRQSAIATMSLLRGGLPGRILLDGFRAALWLSPFLLLSAIAAVFDIARRLRKGPRPEMAELQLASFVVIVWAVYFYANATASGFPKYLIPTLPMIACLTAKYIYDGLKGAVSGRSAAVITACVSGGAAYYFSVCGDMIYQAYALRAAQLENTLSAAIRGLLYKEALYFLFPCAVIMLTAFFIRTTLIRRLAATALIALLASNLAIDLRQRGAGYATNYSYGTEGAQELKDFLRAKQPPRALTAIESYVANAGDVDFHIIPADVWDDPARFKAFIQKTEPPCLIYGPAGNTVFQLRHTMKDPSVAEYLGRNYNSTVIGSYTVLLRRRS